MADLINNIITKYNGAKLAFVVMGGGIGIHQLAQTMGASKVLYTIFVPYSYEVSEQFIDDNLEEKEIGKKYLEKSVSLSSSRLLCMAGMKKWPEAKVIACTAATTTNRWRRGNNEAFITVATPLSSLAKKIEDFHLPLTKLSKEEYDKLDQARISWKRKKEDQQITEFLLKLVMETQ